MSVAVTSQRALMADVDFQPLKRYVIENTGLSYYNNRDELLAQRLGQRLAINSFDTCQSYLNLLRTKHAGETELDCLIQSLTIGETYFFRHTEAFDALRETVIPEIVEGNAHDHRMRIWSAGSSIGAEAYSLSILLKRDLAHLVRGWDISILGTDINRHFLTRAAGARYEQWALRGLNPTLIEECFVSQAEQSRLRRKYREGVTFQYHNLVRHPFPSLSNNIFAFDLILCRNVLIYFDTETIRQVVDQMWHCLVPGGWLIVGHAEYNSQVFAEYEPNYDHGLVLYRKPLNVEHGTSSDMLKPPSAGKPHSVCSVPYTFVPAALGLPKVSQRNISHVRPISKKPVVSSKVAAKPAPDKLCELQEVRRLADKGEIDAALCRCDELREQLPLLPEIHFSRALLLDQQGDHAGAEHSLNKAIYLNRKYVMAHYYRGLVMQKRGLREDASKSYSNVLSLISELEEGTALPESEGMSAADLKELTEMHLGMVRQA